MITCIDKKDYGVKDGKQLKTCWLLADVNPDSFPTSGNGVVNMEADEYFAPGSFVQIVSSDSGNGKVYFYNGSGWYQWA